MIIAINSCITIVTQVLRHDEFTEAGEIEIKRFLKKKADLLQKVMQNAMCDVQCVTCESRLL